MTESSTQESTEAATPVIIDLGKVNRKKAKQLKKGKGPLAKQVSLAIQQVEEQLGEKPDNGVLPVVVLFEKKPKKRRALLPLL